MEESTESIPVKEPMDALWHKFQQQLEKLMKDSEELMQEIRHLLEGKLRNNQKLHRQNLLQNDEVCEMPLIDTHTLVTSLVERICFTHPLNTPYTTILKAETTRKFVIRYFEKQSNLHMLSSKLVISKKDK